MAGIVGLSGRITGNTEEFGITTEALVEVLAGEPFFHEKTKVEGCGGFSGELQWSRKL